MSRINWPSHRDVSTDEYPDTKLADRTASLSARPTAPPAPLSPHPSTGKERADTPAKNRPPSSQEDPDSLQRLRTDLSSTQKARLALQTQVSTLTTTLSDLQLQQNTTRTQLSTLQRQKADLERKLKDREEEIRMKAKLVERAQDEQVAQALQLNMAEERAGKLERENAELVERWMKRVGEEAERVNRDSRWE